MSAFYTRYYICRGDNTYWKGMTPKYETFENFGTYWSLLVEEDSVRQWKAQSAEPITYLLTDITNDPEEMFLINL